MYKGGNFIIIIPFNGKKVPALKLTVRGTLRLPTTLNVGDGTERVMFDTNPGVRVSFQSKNLWFVVVLVVHWFSI